MARGHEVFRTPASKEDFLRVLKWLWRVLLPELDEKGRVDERITPYPVRHISSRVDKSKGRLRNDRLTQEDFERIVQFFSSDPRMQAYITLAFESLGRPQEICYTRIRDFEQHENYAKVWVSSHGKEGTKFLHCIESYPYLMKWYTQHPHQGDPDAFLFVANGRKDQSLTPANINRKLRLACAKLGIEKSVSAYSLKRNGVTHRRLRGDSDVEIQHVAGWTSTKQLQTYDLSTPEDAFQKQLMRKGLAADSEHVAAKAPQMKQCVCGAQVGFADKVCNQCKRVTDPNQTRRELAAEHEIREVMAMALENPNQSLGEIVRSYRLRAGAQFRSL